MLSSDGADAAGDVDGAGEVCGCRLCREIGVRIRSSDDDADNVGGFSEAGEVGGAGCGKNTRGSGKAGDVNFCCAGLKQP